MASTTTNIFANLMAQAWSSILGLIFIPVYLNYVGVESYGLIGVFMSLFTFLSLLDFGISPTMNREMARLSVSVENAQEMSDMKRTLQVLNAITALIILIILCIASPLMARYWVQPKGISVQTVTQSFFIISFIAAIQFFSSFNAGGLLGLQKQVLLNTIYIICGTLRSVGAWLVLAFYSPTIQAFLGWQLIVMILQAFLTSYVLNKSIFHFPPGGRFRKDLVNKVWRFAVGMTATGVLALILTQTDKIILSKMLNLEEFGYYSLAISIGSLIIGMITSSVTNVIYPKYSRLVAIGDSKQLTEFYHRSCQLMTFIILPVVLIIAFYSYPILLIWTGKPDIADNAYLLLTLTAVGTGLNGLNSLPYHLQLAHSWTRLGFYLLLASIFTLVPLMIVGVYYFGAVGGIIGWVIYNGLYGLIMVLLMHRRILKGEQWHWFMTDTFKPAIVCIAFNAVVYYFISGSLFSYSRFLQVAILCIIGLSTALICVWVLPSVKNIFTRKFLFNE